MENIYRKGGNIKFLCIHLDRTISEMRCPVRYIISAVQYKSPVCSDCSQPVLQVMRTNLNCNCRRRD